MREADPLLRGGVLFQRIRVLQARELDGDAILDVIYARKDAKTALTEAAMRIERMLK